MDAAFFTAWLAECAAVVAAHRDRLTELDAAIGDADHGANLTRGFTAIQEAAVPAQAPADDPAPTPTSGSPLPPGKVVSAAGSLLIRKVGGASGPLYGTALRLMGQALGDAPQVSPADLATALEAGVVAVERLGKAAVGDKTMIDALRPAAAALALAVQDGVKLEEALDRAATAAEAGARATAPLRARKGRASYLGERSEGHEDPGAASAALLVRALHTVAARW
ncbi:dihydroxyacetone kinase subunit DhaL [Nonomuraea sp. NPDC050328]|uniref:dihydroxyacetone kinase subunit DhaL n=1 Tax=Nonomuraea sp. NPDC050328 TaxID=3364361 RepID=UPI0037AE3841